ncbi:hypothetical protein RINTU1_22110 [Candidatus Regiella insecticola]|uniref:Uncharacterized protein n=1 Tax=Candidatus Regiella insecticola TaxID=138073 RepID=A0A6L2ZP67_9ENTR|nr:hypothetical protein RINTU1_22110 [Candidatus Regiella insecticola]
MLQILAISAVQIMCPDIKWPPISSPNFTALSKLTSSPTLISLRLVISRVSFITSKLIKSWSMAVTDKQQPLCATEAPNVNPGNRADGNLSVWIRKSVLPLMATTGAVP